MKLPHLLVFGWYRPGTGFTRVLEALTSRWRQSFRMTWFGTGYQGPEHRLADNLKLVPTNLRGGDLMGIHAAKARWRELGADAIFALNDLWYLEHFSETLGPIREQVPMLGYLPLDGRLVRAEQAFGVQGFSRLITYTQAAATDLRAALRTGGIGTAVEVAGHGIDLSRFAPAPSVVAAESALNVRMRLAMTHFGLPAPGFVVLNASRPDPRKRLDLTLDGFARFAQGLPENVYLCLHQAIAPTQFVEPLRAQARALGIERRLLWSPVTPGPVDDDQLAALYNACALGLNTALGEGFGLVSFEHAATGVPQLLPDLPALRELWGDAAHLLGPVREVRVPSSPLLMGEIDAASVAAGLLRLYADPHEYQRLSQAALKRARTPEFSWDAVAAQMLRLLQTAMDPVRS
jgi:glycosyltransferase involved in cell wall biosynthesis